MSLPKPYYQHAGITIYCGDCRDIIPKLDPVDAIITDPVWPNSVFPGVNPAKLLSEALEFASASRVVVHLGCDSDPRFLAAVPARWPFIRVCWLDYARPSYKGRILYGSDVAYIFGTVPPPSDGQFLMPGKCMAQRTGKDIQREILGPLRSSREFTQRGHEEEIVRDHPCPRRIQHVAWLVKWFSGDTLLDPFLGSGTTVLAAKSHSKKAIGIEIEERFCEIAANRLSQEVFELC